MSIQASEGFAHSPDGTSIGYMKFGTGPGLVVVHGSLTTGDGWFPVATALGDRFTSYVMDRRGRGRSGDTGDYSISKECEDIKAVLDVAGPGSFLLGHSYGAICALEVASRVPVSRLVLYEPPLPIHDTVVGPAFKDFRSAVERKELDEALTIGLRDFVKVSTDEITGLRRTPLWAGMAALTPTWTRECEAIDRLELGVSRFDGLASPTLLLVGTATAPHHVEASRALEQVLPDARLVELKDQGHQAHLTATADFVAAVAHFLGEKRGT